MKYCFWLTGWLLALVPPLLGVHFGPVLGVIFSPYNRNLEGTLRDFKRPPFRGLELPFLFLCNRKD
jgi:hypothetical protein